MDVARANGFLGNLGISNSLANFLINLNQTHPQNLQNQYPFSKGCYNCNIYLKDLKKHAMGFLDSKCPVFLPTPYEIEMSILQNDL